MNVLGLKITVEPVTKQQRWTRRAVAIGALNAVVLGGGLAYANWSTSGSGTGAGSAGSALPVNGSVTTVASSATLLYPGLSAPLIVNVRNPNPFPVKISAVTLTNGQAPSSVSGSPKNATTCTASASVVTLVGAASATGLTTAIAAGGDATVTLSSAVTMGLASDDGCQNAVFNFSTGIAVTAAAG